MSATVSSSGRCYACDRFVSREGTCDCENLVRHDLLGIGVLVDFNFKCERTAEAMVVTVSWTPPRICHDRKTGMLVVFPP